MLVLKELAHQLEAKQVLKRIPETCSARKERQIRDLWRLLKEKPDWTETEIARALFGKTRTASHPPYQALIEEVTWAALQELLEPRGRYVSRPNRHDLMMRCDRMITLLDNLASGLNESQVQFWRKLGNACKRCDYVSLEFESLRRQHRFYAFQQLDEKKLAQIEKRIAKLSVLQKAVDLSKSAALAVRMAMEEGEGITKAVNLTAIRKAVDNYPNFDIQCYGGEALISLAMHQEDYAEALRRIDQVSENILARFPLEDQLLMKLGWQKLQGYVALEDYPAGIASWRSLLVMSKENSSKKNCLKVVEAGMLLVLRCENTTDIEELLLAFATLGGISQLTGKEKFRWRAIFASLQLLSELKQQPNAELEGLLRKLNRGEVVKHSHRADEITTVIAEACRQLIAGNTKKAGQLIEPLSEGLPKKLLPSVSSYRRTLFLLLLTEAAAVNFHPVAVVRKTSSLQARLRESAPKATWTALSNELISFNTLWSVVAGVIFPANNNVAGPY